MPGQSLIIADIFTADGSEPAGPNIPGPADRRRELAGNLRFHHFNAKELQGLRGALGHLRVHDQDPEVLVVPDGIVPKGDGSEKILGVFDRDFRLVRGSLEAERHLTRGQYRPDAAERTRLRRDPRAAYYLGVGEGQYGHFLLETLSRAWAWRSEDGLVPVIQSGLPRIARPFYELIPGLLQSVVSPAQSMQYDRVVIPLAAFVIGRGVHVTLKTMCEQIAERALVRRQPVTEQPLYLSRTRLDPASRHGLVGEHRLERYLENQGFAISHPQELSVREQIALFNRHKWIVSPIGSACHTRLFTLGTTNFVMLANPRFLRNFVLCDSLCEGTSHYLNVLSTPDLGVDVGQNFWEPFMLNEDRLLASLTDFGLVKAGSAPAGPAPGAREYIEKWIAIARRQAERNPPIRAKLLQAVDRMSAATGMG